MLFHEESPYTPPLGIEYTSYDDLKRNCLECARCQLRNHCQQVVFGAGNTSADLLFVGEGPGLQEDIEGEPFVGTAGKLLNTILHAAEIKREEVYITNVVKCRPKGNRTPTLSEMKGCIDYLYWEIELIRPGIIVPLGAVALKGLLDPKGSITRSRGQWAKRGDYYLLPTYHPAALLHDEKKKRPAWMDFLKIKKAYERYQEIKKNKKGSP